MLVTSGEYLVAAQMNLHEWYVNLTMKKYPMIDIIGKDVIALFLCRNEYE